MRYFIVFQNDEKVEICNERIYNRLKLKKMIEDSDVVNEHWMTVPCEGKTYVDIMSSMWAMEGLENAIRLPSDVNGNPRYYLSVCSFFGEGGVKYRPFNATMYRGKKYGAGWVFQSYNLERSLQIAYEHHLKEEVGQVA